MQILITISLITVESKSRRIWYRAHHTTNTKSFWTKCK